MNNSSTFEFGFVRAVRRISRVALLGAATLWLMSGAFAPPAYSQGGSSGRVSGAIHDQTGANVPGATVILRDEATGTELKTVSDAGGFYAIDPVPSKTYSLIVQMKGFKTYTQRNLVVTPGSRLEMPVTLQVGTEVQMVEVTASAAQLTTTTSGAKTDVIGSRQIENLATEGRNAMELLTLLPGIVNSGFNPEFGSNMGQGINQFNVNGLRTDQNSIRLDNANMIDPGNNGGFIIEPNMDMIQEFSVKASSFEADQGRAALIVEAVTKSGGSKVHGTVYYYMRNAALNANDWTSNQAGLSRPGSKFNYPGFNIGGPVRIPGSDFNKNNDKMFFFGAMEWQRQLPDFGTQLAVVPSAAMRQGDFSQLLTDPACAGKSRCLNMPTKVLDYQSGGGWGNSPLPGNIIPQSEINANSALLLNQYPLPNYYDPNGNYNYAGRPLYPLNRDEENVRVDYNLTDNVRMYARLSRNHDTQYYPWGLWSGIGSNWTSNIPEPTPTVGDNLGESVSVNLVNVINPTLTNEFQFNVSQLTLPNHFQDPSKISKSALGFQFKGLTFQNSQVPAFANGVSYKGDELPQITDQWNFYNGGNPGTGRWGEGDVGSGIFADKTIFEFIDNLTKVKGTHTMKFGGNLERVRNDQNGGPVTEGLLITAENWGGETTGNSFGDILVNNFPSYDQGVPNNDGRWRYWTAEGYLQDSWKAARRLTLNYGARVSWMQPLNEAGGHSTAFLRSLYDPSQPTNFLNGIGTGIGGQISHSTFPNPKPIIQPRLGFAYDVFGTGKTVVRGGFGNYISRDQGNISFGQANAPPYTFSAAINAPGPFYTLQQIENSNPFSALGNIALSSEDPNDRNQPQTYEWNFTLEQNVGLKTVVSASYVGNVSRHLLRQMDLNVINPGGMWIPGTNVCCANGSTNTPDYVPYKPFGAINWLTHSDTANYNSLQATVRRNVSHGLTLLGSYTWSKTLGYTSSFQGVTDPFNSKRYYGLLPYDHANILNFSYIYQLPNAGAKYFTGNRIAKGVLDNWQFSGITHFTGGGPVFITNPTINCTMEAGAPVNLCANDAIMPGSRFSGAGVGWYGTPDLLEFNTTNAQGNTVRPFINWQPGNFKNVGDHWFSGANFSLPDIGQFGTFETPTYRGPSSSEWDMTLFKSFPFGEGRRVEFRFAGFNVFNHANLSTSGAYFTTTPIFNWVLPANATSFADGHSVLANPNDLGTIRTKTGHREVEMALKIYF
jgi:Carboxypeptidase regulatory-like domain/TonB-dependent Receptor Plug Domain